MAKTGPIGELARWIVAGVAMVVITLLISFVWLHGTKPDAMVAGWIVAIVNGLVATAINRRALCKGKIAFVLWGLAGNLARFVALVAVVGTVYLLRVFDFVPFLTAFLSGYFAFLSWEISGLVTLTSVEKNENE